VLGAAGPDQLSKITLSDPKAVQEIRKSDIEIRESGIDGNLIHGSTVEKLEQGGATGVVGRVERCGDGVLDPDEQCDDVRCSPWTTKTVLFPAHLGF
jgi:hypothetical protein